MYSHYTSKAQDKRRTTPKSSARAVALLYTLWRHNQEVPPAQEVTSSNNQWKGKRSVACSAQVMIFIVIPPLTQIGGTLGSRCQDHQLVFELQLKLYGYRAR